MAGLAKWSKACVGHPEVEKSSPIGGAQKADMKFLEQTKCVTNEELEKRNTLCGLKMILKNQPACL